MKKVLINVCFLLSIVSSGFAFNIEDKLSQLMVLPICPALGQPYLSKAQEFVKTKPLGGILLLPGDLASQKQIIQQLQNESLVPLLCMQDAEYGVGMRLKDVPPMPWARTMGAIMDDPLLLEAGREIGRQCRLAGIHLNLAPVADVNNNPYNPVINMRAFGEYPQQVARASKLIMQGMQEKGIMTCAKHFPGHGDTRVDSHKELPVIPHSLERVKAVELPSFAQLIEAGVDAMIIGHLSFPALEPTCAPASLSRKITTDLLRGEMGFKGLIISDALNMKALENHYSIEEIAVLAFEAGCDLLLYADSHPEDLQRIYEDTIPRALKALKEAYLCGRITEDQIDAKLERINRAKERFIRPAEEGTTDTPELYNLRKQLYRAALKQVGPKPPPNALISTYGYPKEDALFAKQFPAKDGDYLLVSIGGINARAPDFGLSDAFIEELKSFKQKGIRLIFALFGSPSALIRLPQSETLFIAFEEDPLAKEAVLETLSEPN